MPDGVVQVLHPDPQLFSHRSERFVPIRRVLDVPDSLISKVQKTNKRCHGPSPLLSDTVLAVADRACWKKTAMPPELRMPQRLQHSDCRVTPGLSRARKLKRSGRWRASAPGRCGPPQSEGHGPGVLSASLTGGSLHRVPRLPSDAPVTSAWRRVALESPLGGVVQR